MGGAAGKSGVMRNALLSAAALAGTAALPAPAFADGGRGGYYSPRHYSYGQNRPYYGDNGYRHRKRGNLSGGEAALIAAGIIGGVILIDRALDKRDRDDRYDGRYDRRYDDRYDRRYDDRYDRRYDDRYDRRGGYDDDYYYQRERDYDDRSDRSYDRDYDDGYAGAAIERSSDLDDRLAGDDDERPLFADAAFRECVAETRGAAGAGGLIVAMPGSPERVEHLADGSVRMSASFRASNGRGEDWSRRFVCEADEQGVRLLQVD